MEKWGFIPYHKSLIELPFYMGTHDTIYTGDDRYYLSGLWSAQINPRKG